MIAVISDERVDSWDYQAAKWIYSTFEVHPKLGDSSIDRIREHMDYLINTHFPNSDNISESDWLRMIEITLACVPELTSDVMWRTVCSKQNDYGPNNILRFGQSGIIIRVHDKVARLENLLSTGRDASNESVADTYMDIIGYSVIALMLLDDTFLLPLGDTWR